jgi:hypothetical protein
VEFEMVSDTNASNTFSLRAYRGDAKTLLTFNFGNKKNTKNLAGFSIACQPKGQSPYYIHNDLRVKIATDHAQDPRPGCLIDGPTTRRLHGRSRSGFSRHDCLQLGRAMRLFYESERRQSAKSATKLMLAVTRTPP